MKKSSRFLRGDRSASDDTRGFLMRLSIMGQYMRGTLHWMRAAKRLIKNRAHGRSKNSKKTRMADLWHKYIPAWPPIEWPNSKPRHEPNEKALAYMQVGAGRHGGNASYRVLYRLLQQCPVEDNGARSRFCQGAPSRTTSGAHCCPRQCRV